MAREFDMPALDEGEENYIMMGSTTCILRLTFFRQLKKQNSGDISVNGRILLTFILVQQVWKVCTGFRVQ